MGVSNFWQIPDLERTVRPFGPPRCSNPGMAPLAARRSSSVCKHGATVVHIALSLIHISEPTRLALI
eukprot:3756884-Alexandrium_andersonii.AAC.1